MALYPLLLDYQQAHPGLIVRHRFAPDAEVLAAVLSNRFEMGIVTYKPDNERIEAQRFAEEPLELILPTAKPYVGFETLSELGFIDHPTGPLWQRAYSAECIQKHRVFKQSRNEASVIR